MSTERSKEHTPGPWRTGITAGGLQGVWMDASRTDSPDVASTGYHEESSANARRIVACVNACEGRSVESLEKDGVFGPLELETLERERDHLKARLESSFAEITRLAALNEELVEALTRLSRVPVEDFGWESKPQQPLHAWNGYALYVSDVLKARAVVAKAKQS